MSWNKGDELFYVEDPAGSNKGPVMGVTVKTDGVFQWDRPRKLFDVPEGMIVWDVTPDGQRFLGIQSVGAAQTIITVVQNWAKEFEGRK